MTLFERIWKEAADTFGKKRGHANPLTPYTRTWKLVIDRAEHAIWMWNAKYGPLNHAQREYAGDLICHSLKTAREAPDCNAVYAYFNATLTRLLNHEKVDAGFDRRADEADIGELDNLLDGAFEMPVAA